MVDDLQDPRRSEPAFLLPERAMLEGLDRLMTGRSVLLITHKPALLARRADEILVLERGRIVERGTHAQLLRRSGWYAECQNILIE